jgi:dolichyl-phosphate-mannose-protein mannosyltransferase
VRRRVIGAAVAGAYLVGVLIMFSYFYAILAAEVLPYPDWLSHIWYRVSHGRYIQDGVGWF